MPDKVVTEREIYGGHLTFADEMAERRKKSKVVSKHQDYQMSSYRMGKGVSLIDPKMGFETNLHMFIAEIPPGKHTGKHRHVCDAAIYILSGKGYTVVEDEKYEWEEGDAVSVPSWAWHQHFNASDSKPVRYLGAVTIPLMMNLGFFKMEQAEDNNY